MYTTKTNNIEKLIVKDISDDFNFEILNLSKKNINSSGSHFSKKLNPPEFDWVYENGQTVRLFLIQIIINNKTELLYVPLTFSEEVKETYRTMIKLRTEYTKISADIPPYNYLDGRKLVLKNISEDRIQRMFEYTLKDDDLSSWKELFTQTLIFQKINLTHFIKSFESDLKKSCPSVYFSSEKLSNDSYFYDWKHDGCKEHPAQHEIAIIMISGENTLNIRYTYKGAEMPENNYLVWKNILKKD